ncbi:hypothetical protein CSB95_3423 [Pseudomonas aeruginosa]|nr:hypothetical protein CSB90_3740 [Pseudomonas aeruginosa]EYT99101.1 hypothetical protein PA99_4091 [Pseudomonas aeruginosa PA99]EYU06293.1 hypothetical protein PA103_2683 [Pseudomonas aeruginosa PA103]SMZ50951.1 hypothetical protein PANN_31090 [Pseudomonas aeruginosa C-NN2]GAA17826.1 hypothetical protein NCGM1179_2657 [Pseudomonas aeruginosa NCMG1179]
MQTQRLVITHDRPPARSGPNGWRDQKRANGARSGGLGGWRVPVLWVGAGCRHAGVRQARSYWVTSLMVRPSGFVFVISV